MRLAFAIALLSVAICFPCQGEDASIAVHVGRVGRPISRRLFGANICWPMYTNNLDQTQHRADDFLALAPLAKQLGLTMLRYPGGLWSDAYRWKRGVGPVEKRRGGSPNGTGEGQMPIIGTDELLRFCDAAGMEAIIAVNYGLSATESPDAAYQEAADWVEYCNAPNDGSNPAGGVDWAAARAANGHPEPYRVRYWEIGNEIYVRQGAFRAKWGHTDVTTYAKGCVAFARAMEAIDPNIEVGAVAHTKPDFVSPNDTRIGSAKPWNRTLLEVAGPYVDFLVPHVYSGGPGGQTALLANNGSVGGEYTASAAGEHTIVARVGGDRFRDAWSHFELRVDGEAVAKLDTSSKRPKPFKHTLHLDAGKHRIDVRFTNDLWVKGEGDRNLYVGGLSVVPPDGTETPVPLIEPQDRLSLCTAAVERDRQKLRDLRQLVREVVPDRADEIELAATEWNEMPEVGTLSTALHCAAKLMMMAEEGIESAHYWLLFNAVQYRRTELWFPAGHVRLPRPPAFALQIMARHCLDRIVECEVTAPTLPPLKHRRKGWPDLGAALRVLTTKGDDVRSIGLVVINRDVDNAIHARLTWPGFAALGQAQVTTLTGDDPFDRNDGCTSMDDLRVRARTSSEAVAGDGMAHTFPPMSVTGITIRSQ